MTLAQGYSSMATFCEHHEVWLVLYPLVVLETMDHCNEWNKWTLCIQQQGTVILSSVYCLWTILTSEFSNFIFFHSISSCYCDFKPHLLMFMQTGCSIGADTLWINVVQKTVCYLFQNTSPGFAYRPSKASQPADFSHMKLNI